MSSLGTSKGVLEIAKFVVYVTTVPIGRMYFFAYNTQNHQKFIGALEVLEEIAKQGFGSNPKDNYENNGGKRPHPISFEVASSASCIAESQDTGSSTSTSSRMMAQDLNDGYHVTEAL